MSNLADIFEKKLKQIGIKKQVDAAMICEAFDKAVFEAFGESGEKNVRAISFQNKTLKVGTTSSAWANEISLKRLDLVGGETARVVFEIINN